MMREWPLWTMALWTVGVCGFTTLALVTDLRSRRIPNVLTIIAFALALVFHLVVSGWAGLGFAAGGFGVGFGVMLVLWLIGGGGGGDVKLMGAVGSWVGVFGTLFVFLGGVIVAVLMTAGILLGRWIAPKRFAFAKVEAGSAQAQTMSRRGARMLIPFAVPVCVATWGFVALKFMTWNH
jgi:prepilin peptidase CpaA